MEWNGVGDSNGQSMGWRSMGGSSSHDNHCCPYYYDNDYDDNYGCPYYYDNDYDACSYHDYYNDYGCSDNYGRSYYYWSSSMLRLYYCIVGRRYILLRWPNEIPILDGRLPRVSW
jgi:hypothetical protein